MKAIEIKTQTDDQGDLNFNYKVGKAESKVRVLILLDDETETDEEILWKKSISSNPAFNFLNDANEDIYSLKDGLPFND